MGDGQQDQAASLPLVTVVVLAYNGRDHLRLCLPTVLAQTYPADRLDVLVVDNASSDGSYEYVQDTFPQVRVVRNPANYGFARGNNIGARLALGEYVAFLNQDTRADRHWLAELVAPILAARQVGDTELVCTGAKMLSWDGQVIDFAGGQMNAVGKATQIGSGQPDGPAFQTERDTLFACGGAMLIDRQVFLDVGGFDDDYFVLFEDVDLGWRLWVLGYRVLLAPRAIVYHRLHASVGQVHDVRKQLIFERNALFSILKNYDDTNLGRVLPASLCLTVYRVLAELRQSGLTPEDFDIRNSRRMVPATVALSAPGASLLLALDEVLERMPGLLDRRRAIQARRQRADAAIAPLFGAPAEPLDHQTGYAELSYLVARAFGIDSAMASIGRHVAVVSRDMSSDGRAAALATALVAAGHRVTRLVHAHAALHRPDALTVEPATPTWTETTLRVVVADQRPDAVVLVGPELIRWLDPTQLPVRLPTIVDLPATAWEPYAAPADAPWLDSAIGRADLVICTTEADAAYVKSVGASQQRLGVLDDVPVVVLSTLPAADSTPAAGSPVTLLDQFIRSPRLRAMTPQSLALDPPLASGARGDAGDARLSPPAVTTGPATTVSVGGPSPVRPATDTAARTEEGRITVIPHMPDRLSVVIPTYNRPDMLAQVLAGLERQSWPRDRLEVIVVDDGGDHPAAPVVDAAAGRGLPVVGERQPNAGPAAARNRGTRRATGQVIVYLDDDCVPTPEWLVEHASGHRRPGAVTTGRITWHPSVPLTPLLRYAGQRALFNFDLASVPDDAPFATFYTANAAVDRELVVQAGLFDESFRYAAWEDTELAYRLRRAGARFLFRSDAIVEHLRGFDLAGFLRRERLAGYEAVRAWTKHPELRSLTGVEPIVGEEIEQRFFETSGRYAWLIGAAEALSPEGPGASVLDTVLAEAGAEPDLEQWRSDYVRDRERDWNREYARQQATINELFGETDRLQKRLKALEATLAETRQRHEDLHVAYQAQQAWARDMEARLKHAGPGVLGRVVGRLRPPSDA